MIRPTFSTGKEASAERSAEASAREGPWRIGNMETHAQSDSAVMPTLCASLLHAGLLEVALKRGRRVGKRPRSPAALSECGWK